MVIVKSIPGLRETVRVWRAAGETVAFVPTMGNLHSGHLQLVKEAQALADRVVTSIYVNPTQFCAGEDFDAYPRTLEQDAAQLRGLGTDLLFLPNTDEMYPPGATTYVEVAGLSDDLCGRFRPGHFRGVATVVCKLLNIVRPDLALFGEKDYQQLTVIRRMVSDLDIPTRIIGVPTVREKNGLAMSSRNGYLTAEEKLQAGLLFHSLLAAKQALEEGNRDYLAIQSEQEERLLAQAFRPDYFAIRRQADLAEPGPDERDFVILAAAWLGKARLIDNIKVSF